MVRHASPDDGAASPPAVAAEPVHDADAAETARCAARGVRWAALMQRTFGFDVLACPRCGGRLRLIALIEDAAVVGRILRHLGVATEVPAPRPARAPPRADTEEPSNWAGWDHETSVCMSSV